MKAGDTIRIKEGYPNAGRKGFIVERARGLNNNGECAIYWETGKMYWIEREKIEVVND